ncbi:MAG TPA: ATP-binding protein [Acidimicrobiales bacterium]|nr:ATP-binding protein [Acidimicrobiales bacterium]
MTVDPSVIAALEEGVRAAPDNFPLRLHLVELLAGAGSWTAVQEHCTVLLAQRPDDRAALVAAAGAADALGEQARGDAYRRLLAALGHEPAPAPPAPTPLVAPAPVSTGGAAEDEYDAFLREVLADADVDVEQPKVTLADVGGLDQAKRRLHTSFLGPMRNPELRAMYGTSLQGGLLLYGPPGCGKTFLARAVAGELRARFFAVGLHEVLDMWLGNSEKNVHAVFETARRNAPCVLFLDEIDALGQKRSNLRHSAGRNVVVQLLTELDGLQSDNQGVFVLGATNQPWDLDPALRRPGRFDRMLLVLPPDEPARVAILQHHLRNRPIGAIDVAGLARRTERYSGADLRLVCESAAEYALEDSLASGTPRPIGGADMERAVRDVRPSSGPWFEVAKNYALFANEGGTYDELLAYMRRHNLG